MHDDFSVQVAKDIGELKADMRTAKHDISNVSAKIDGLATQIATINTKQERGFGFFAGIAFILALPLGVLIFIARMIFPPHTP